MNTQRENTNMVRYISLITSVCILLAAVELHAEIFYLVDFEDGSTDASVGSSNHETIGGSISAVSNPDPDNTNNSSMVGRCSVPSSDSKVRAELSSQRLVTEGQTYRYRWSYYIPTGFFDGATINWFVNSQWKTWPCEVCNPDYDPAICGGCGGIFDEVRVVDEQWWEFRWRAEPDCHEHTESVIFGQWVRFEMLVKWTKDSSGYVRLWRDGVLIKSLDDIRTLFTSFENDRCDMYWSIGLYASWTGTSDSLELYIDDIEISDDTTILPDGGPTEDGGPADDGGPTDDGGLPADEGADGDPVTDDSDSGLGDEDTLAARCTETYGTVSGFVLCDATTTSCSFNAQKESTLSCSDVCEAHGGECLAAHGNSTEAPCTQIEEISCDVADHVDDICVCSLPGADEHESQGQADASVSDADDGDSIDNEQDDSVGGGCACSSRGHSLTSAIFGLLFFIAAFRRHRKQ
jgi:polysaccharide lyase-like protein